MAQSSTNKKLADLLIAMSESLVQYVGECWPWVDTDEEAEQQAILDIVRCQQAHISQLAELLSERLPFVEFGEFPTVYSDLHYVALDYLLDQLIQADRALIAQMEQTLAACGDDPQAATLVSQILEDEREHLETLQGLAETRAAQAA